MPLRHRSQRHKKAAANPAAADLSLKLGQGKEKNAKKGIDIVADDRRVYALQRHGADCGV